MNKLKDKIIKNEKRMLRSNSINAAVKGNSSGLLFTDKNKRRIIKNSSVKQSNKGNGTNYNLSNSQFFGSIYNNHNGISNEFLMLLMQTHREQILFLQDQINYLTKLSLSKQTAKPK